MRRLMNATLGRIAVRTVGGQSFLGDDATVEWEFVPSAAGQGSGMANWNEIKV
jgi:hypothetical protein